MKKLPFYIALGVAGAAIAALVIIEIRRRNQPVNSNTIPHGEDYVLGPDSNAAKTFHAFNQEITLNSRAVNVEAEVTALQHMINAYYGGTQSVFITGKFDNPTRAAVKAITGKSSTSLYEFLYHYLIPKRGEKVGTDLLISLTQNNNR